MGCFLRVVVAPGEGVDFCPGKMHPHLVPRPTMGHHDPLGFGDLGFGSRTVANMREGNRERGTQSTRKVQRSRQFADELVVRLDEPTPPAGGLEPPGSSESVPVRGVVLAVSPGARDFFVEVEPGRLAAVDGDRG